MKVIAHCGACQPDADPAALMGDALEASCAHCGCVVTRQRQWKPSGAGVVVGVDVFECVPPEERPTVPAGRA